MALTFFKNDIAFPKILAGKLNKLLKGLDAMVFKGTLGSYEYGPTITSLPVNGTADVGDTYKVITDGTYAGQLAKVGDLFICNEKTSSTNAWVLVPSGDDTGSGVDSTNRTEKLYLVGATTQETNPGTVGSYNGVYETAGTLHTTNLEVGPNYAHGGKAVAEGDTTQADELSHSEGVDTFAKNESHSEGRNVFAIGDNSHAEGYGAYATGNASHVEGYGELYDVFTGNPTTRGGGSNFIQFPISSITVTSGETYDTITVVCSSIPSAITPSEINNKLSGDTKVFHFRTNYSAGNGSTYIVPSNTTQISAFDSATTTFTLYTNDGFHVAPNINQGVLNNFKTLRLTHPSNIASGDGAHAEGCDTQANGVGSHAEGNVTKTTGNYSHSEGHGTLANGVGSHAEGFNTISVGDYSHSEGGQDVLRKNRPANLRKLDEPYEDCEYEWVNGINGVPARTIIDTNSNIICHFTRLKRVLIPGETSPKIYVNFDNNELLDEKLEAGVALYVTLYYSEYEYTQTVGKYSHAEGSFNRSIGDCSHTEGKNNVAIGVSSHAEGYGSTCMPLFYDFSWDENSTKINIIGATSQFISENSIVCFLHDGIYEYRKIVAYDDVNNAYFIIDAPFSISGDNEILYRHASSAYGDYSHAEGYGTQSNGVGSHAEGFYTDAIGDSSHAEGYNTGANGSYSHAEGCSRTYGVSSHAEGGFYETTHIYHIVTPGSIVKLTESVDNYKYESFIGPLISGLKISKFYTTTTSSTVMCNITDTHYVQISDESYKYYFNVDDEDSLDNALEELECNYALWKLCTTNVNVRSFSSNTNTASGDSSHAEGCGTQSNGVGSHAEGYGTQSNGVGSHAEGFYTDAIGDYSHAEGYGTQSNGVGSHAEGYATNGALSIGVRRLTEEEREKGYLKTGEYFDFLQIDSDNCWYGDIYTNNEKLATVTSLIDLSSFHIIEGIGSGYLLQVDNPDNLTTSTTQSSVYTIYSPLVLSNNNGSHAEGCNTQANHNGSHAEGGSTYANGDCSHAEGWYSKSIKNSSHAEGYNSVANGSCSHAEGCSRAYGDSSHAEGCLTQAIGANSHAEGELNKAIGYNSHAEGGMNLYEIKYGQIRKYEDGISVGTTNPTIYKYAINFDDNIYTYFSTLATGMIFSPNILDHNKVTITQSGSTDIDNTRVHVFNVNDETKFDNWLARLNNTTRNWSLLNWDDNHLPYAQTIASGASSHAEGCNTQAVGVGSHAEGFYTDAIGDYSHAEGYTTNAVGGASHAEGDNTYANGDYSHAEGSETKAVNDISHAEGAYTISYGESSHAEGTHTCSAGDSSHAEGYDEWWVEDGDDVYDGIWSWDANSNILYLVDDYMDEPSSYDIVQLFNPEINGDCAIRRIVGWDYVTYTLVLDKPVTFAGVHQRIYQMNHVAYGVGSHAEGTNTFAIGNSSHAEGKSVANGDSSHAEGCSHANGVGSHAEGYLTITGSNDSEYIEIYEGRLVFDYNDQTCTMFTRIQNINFGDKLIIEIPDVMSSGITYVDSSPEWDGTKLTFKINPYVFGDDFETGDGIIHTVAGYSGLYAHAEGVETRALSTGSHAGGLKTVANQKYMTAIGKYNTSANTSGYLFVVGNGTGDSARTDAFIVNQSGNCYASGAYYALSDERKKNIINNIPLDKAYELVDKCQSIFYSWKNDETKKQEIGLIAQEVQEYFPELVSEGSDGYLSLDYARLTVVLMAVIRDLTKKINKIDDLEAKLKELESKL